MEDMNKEMVDQLKELNKEIKRVAEALSVFKVATIAFIISLLAVLYKNFML